MAEVVQISQAQGVPDFNSPGSPQAASHPAARFMAAMDAKFFGNPLWEYAFFVLLLLATLGVWHYIVSTLHRFTKSDVG